MFMGVFYLLFILQGRSGFLLFSPSLTVLYMPYYVLGYLCETTGLLQRCGNAQSGAQTDEQIGKETDKQSYRQTGRNTDRILALCLIAVCGLVFLFLVIRYPLTAPVKDTLTLAVQMGASLTGTVAIFGGTYLLPGNMQQRKEMRGENVQTETYINAQTETQTETQIGTQPQPQTQKPMAQMTAGGLLAFIGQFTLEIYVLHFRFARLLGIREKNLQ